MNDSGDIIAEFTASERAIDKLQQPTIEIERTRNAIRESSNGEQRIAEAKKEISRLGGLIAWQDNRSKQFKTIIDRGY
jgi:hypothetical protein